ncbi:MAG: hypothetical protein LDL12_00625 [Anaerolinea sp.]|nr:hypothetical protein [Anaerolinea sp.]
MSKPTHFLSLITVLLLSLFFGIVLSAQLLGATNSYTPTLAILLGLLLSVAAFVSLLRSNILGYAQSTLGRPTATRLPAWLQTALFSTALLLLTLLVLLPLARWPFSHISETLHWDAGIYHLPKAVELYRSGTLWDLSIPFGEFPNGYEALLSFTLSLSHADLLFGSVHAAIALLFFLSLFLLARRLTDLPEGLLALLIVVLMISGRVTLAYNPWWIFSDLLYTIGKNDLLAGTLTLLALFFAPIGRESPRPAYHWPALALVTFLALCTKPYAAYALLPVWLLVFWRESQHTRPALPYKTLLLATLIVLPGIWWVVRNLIVLGVIFPPEVLEMQQWSILSNLTNPFFYNYLPRNFVFVLIISGLLLLIGLLRKRLPPWFVATQWLLLLTFIATAETAFFRDTQKPTVIAWRFGIALLSFTFLSLLILLEPLLLRLMRALLRWRPTAPLLGLLLVGLTIFLIWNDRSLLRYVPENGIVLRDQFREPVGKNGYHSAYDYLQKNIRNSVIQVENGLVYYAYGPGYTNSPTKLQYPWGMAERVPQLTPQYFLVFERPWMGGESGYSPTLDTPEWAQRWELIYEDGEGRLYRRR